MSRIDRIRQTLEDTFQPESLQVDDDSHLHAGHAGARPGGETHYRVAMVASAFEGMSRVDRQRAVNKALAAEFADGLHALQLNLRTP